MRSSSYALIGATLALTAGTAGQQPSGAVPQFRSSARLVQVSVVVRDRNDRAVEGLDRAAFQIFEDGQEQPIAFFLPASRSDRGKETARPVPAGSLPRFTNRILSPSTGGVVAIIFDQLNTSAAEQMRARSHLLKYLRTLQPGDRVALYVLGADRLQVLYDFTTDAEMLLRALDSVTTGSAQKMGVSDQQVPPTLLESLGAFSSANLREISAGNRRLRAEMTLENLEHVAAHLAGVPGRKNILWLSAGFPFVIKAGDNMAAETKRAMRALNTVDATLYPVDVRGLIGGRGAALPSLNTIYGPIDSLRTAAEATGGRAFFNTNGLSEAMTRAVEDSESTYVLGYYPTNSDWNGKFRNIKVKVARAGMEVRHRPGYLADLPAPAAPDNQQRTLLDVLRAPLEATTLPFDITADVTAERTLLRLYVDASDLALTEAAGRITGEMDVAITQMLKDGRQVPEEMSSSYPFGVPVADRDRLLATPIELTRTIRLAPDARQVRVVIRDSRSASIGSIFIDAERLRPADRR